MKIGIKREDYEKKPLNLNKLQRKLEYKWQILNYS